MAGPVGYRIASALALLAGLSIGGCALAPAAGQNQLMLVSDARWQTHRLATEQTLGSLQPLTDAAARSRQPRRIQIGPA